MALKQMRPAQREGLCSTPSRNATESASQTFERVAILIRNVGRLEEATNDASTVGTIVGVAEEGGANAAVGASVRYTPALPHIVFEANIETTPATQRVLAQTDLFTAFALAVDADGVWYLDASDAVTANRRCVVVGFRDDVGTAEGRAYVSFIPERTVYSPDL